MKSFVKPIFFIIAVALILLMLNYASGLTIITGNIYFSQITGSTQTQRWGGAIGFINSPSLEETNLPIGFFTINNGNEILTINITGDNLLNGKYYVGILPLNDTFNLTKVVNITPGDLEINGIFSQDIFPVFYPNYYLYSDNPNATFCCNETIVKIGGESFKAYKTILKNNIEYYVLRYDYNSTHSVPLFLAPIAPNYVCYNGNACNFEFIVPVKQDDYYIYVLNKEPPIKLEVWIDGNPSSLFSQTALTYNLTVRATNIYNSNPIPNLSVVVFEENGNNIFLPKLLSGKIGRGISQAYTSDEGYAYFIVAPTEYPPKSDYRIGVAVYDGISLQREVNLTVVNADSIVFTSKNAYLADYPSLLDNAKTSVNAMSQIINSLYIWANQEKAAIAYDLVVYTNGTYYFVNASDNQRYSDAILKTGAPNIIKVILKDPSNVQIPGYAMPEEKRGYLLFNPTYNADNVSQKTEINQFLDIETNTPFVITPSNYGSAFSNVSIYVYDSAKNLVNIINVTIDPNLEPRQGIYYEDDIMKTIINAMSSVVYSLYYSLNY